MAEDLIRHYIDPVSFEGDTKFAVQQLATLEAAYKKLADIRINLKDPTNTKSVVTDIQAATSSIKDLTSMVSAQTSAVKEKIIVSAKEYQALVAQNEEAKKRITVDRESLKTTAQKAAVQKAEAKAAADASNDYKQLSLAFNDAAIKAKNYQIQLGANHPLAIEATKDANDLGNKLKELDASVGQRQRNVGNYEGSAKIIVDALEKEKIKVQSLTGSYQNFTTQLNNSRSIIAGFAGDASKLSEIKNQEANITGFTAEIKKLEPEIEKAKTVIEGFSRITAQPNFLNVAGKVGDANQELKFFTKSLIDLERQGQGSSDAAEALRDNLAELTDQIGDAKGEIKALSSDTRGFDLFAGSVTFAADAFQTFAGAAVLAGASEEDAAEATKTLVAVQSVANGVKGIANELTTRGTAANKVYAFAQNQVAIAMDTTAAAGARLKAALVTIGIGALIIGIGLLVANFSKIKEALSGITPQQKLFNELNKEAVESAGKEAGQLKILRASIEGVNVPMTTRLQGIKNLKEQYPGLFDAYTNEELLTGKVANAYDLAAAAILRKAKAQAAGKQIEDLSAKQLAIELKEQEDSIETNNKIRNAKSDVSVSSGGSAGVGGNLGGVSKEAKRKALLDDFNERQADRKKEKDELQKQQDFLLTFAVDGTKETTKIDKVKKEKAGKAAASVKESTKASLDSQFELYKLDQERIIKLLDDQLSDETLSFSKRISLLNQFSTEKINLIDAQAKEDLRKNAEREAALQANLAKAKGTERNNLLVEIKNNETARESIEKNAGIARQVVFGDNEKHFTDITQKENNRRNKIEKDSYDRAIKLIEDEGFERRAALEKEYQEGGDGLQARFEAGKISQEKYNKKRLDLDFAYAVESLQIEIDTVKKKIAVGLVSGENQKKALYELAKLERQLQDASVAHTKKTEAEKLAAIEKTLGTIKEVSEHVFEFISGMLNANAVAEKNKLREQQDEAEKKASLDVDRVNASTATEEQKAAKILIINARLAAQKEQIAQKERQAEIAQSRFAKAAAIFNIILLTTQAVIKAYKDGITLPDKIAGAIVAGAAGAAQLAVAIATPIPRYRYGKGSHDSYEGLAVVGDAGKQEVIKRKDGSFEITPATDTLTHIGRNEMIYPDLSAWMRSMAMPAIGKVKDSGNAKNDVVTAIEKQNILLRQIADKKELTLGADNNGMIALFKWGSRQIKYVQDNCDW